MKILTELDTANIISQTIKSSDRNPPRPKHDFDIDTVNTKNDAMAMIMQDINLVPISIIHKSWIFMISP